MTAQIKEWYFSNMMKTEHQISESSSITLTFKNILNKKVQPFKFPIDLGAVLLCLWVLIKVKGMRPFKMKVQLLKARVRAVLLGMSAVFMAYIFFLMDGGKIISSLSAQMFFGLETKFFEKEITWAAGVQCQRLVVQWQNCFSISKTVWKSISN